MRARPLTMLTCLAGLVAACDPTVDHTALGPTGSPGPLASSVSPAAAGGAIILRFSTASFILIFDSERQLLSAHMPSDICGDGNLSLAQVVRVTTPSQIGQRFAQITSDDEQVAVYHATSPADAGLSAAIDFFGFANIFDLPTFCAFLAGPNRIAEGQVKRLSTFSLASFHARWTGIIQGVDGLDYHLTEIYQLNADAHDPTNPATFAQQVSNILLHPLP